MTQSACSWRRLVFGHQHPCQQAAYNQSPVTLAPGDLMPSSGLSRRIHTQHTNKDEIKWGGQTQQ